MGQSTKPGLLRSGEGGSGEASSVSVVTFSSTRQRIAALDSEIAVQVWSVVPGGICGVLCLGNFIVLDSLCFSLGTIQGSRNRGDHDQYN